MKRSTWLALRMLAVVLLIGAAIGGVLLLSLNKSDTAKRNAGINEGRIERNAKRIATNENKDDQTRRCQTNAIDVQRCIERITGAVGPGGATGRTGRTGARGLEGLRGQRGRRGPKGDRGEPGPRGKAGVRGLQGIAGIAGTTSADGNQGAKGEPGERGPQGEPGPQGPSGIPGQDGAPGAPGVNGVDGQPGAPGTLVISIETCAVPGMTATDPNGDGVFTCEP